MEQGFQHGFRLDVLIVVDENDVDCDGSSKPRGRYAFLLVVLGVKFREAVISENCIVFMKGMRSSKKAWTRRLAFIRAMVETLDDVTVTRIFGKCSTERWTVGRGERHVF